MANKSKDAGTTWETTVVKWLVENGYPDARRNALSGTKDSADIDPVPACSPPIIISAKWGYGTSCKHCNRRSEVHPQTELFGKWWFDLHDTRRRRNSDALALLCHHRPGKASPDSAHWYVSSGQIVGPDRLVAANPLYNIGLVKITGVQALEVMGRYAPRES